MTAVASPPPSAEPLNSKLACSHQVNLPRCSIVVTLSNRSNFLLACRSEFAAACRFGARPKMMITRGRAAASSHVCYPPLWSKLLSHCKGLLCLCCSSTDRVVGSPFIHHRAAPSSSPKLLLVRQGAEAGSLLGSCCIEMMSHSADRERNRAQQGLRSVRSASTNGRKLRVGSDKQELADASRVLQ